MAEASNFLIGANDEHGLNPPTAGKRTPIMPYINRSFYENEFNRAVKLAFMYACLRCGFNVYDVKPEIQDLGISPRVIRINRAGLTLLVTFAYNAFGTGQNFNSAQGIEVYYSPFNTQATQSRQLAEEIFEKLSKKNDTKTKITNDLITIKEAIQQLKELKELIKGKDEIGESL